MFGIGLVIGLYVAGLVTGAMFGAAGVLNHFNRRARREREAREQVTECKAFGRPILPQGGSGTAPPRRPIRPDPPYRGR